MTSLPPISSSETDGNSNFPVTIPLGPPLSAPAPSPSITSTSTSTSTSVKGESYKPIPQPIQTSSRLIEPPSRYLDTSHPRSGTTTTTSKSGTGTRRRLTLLSPVTATLDGLQVAHPSESSSSSGRDWDGSRRRAHTVSVCLPSQNANRQRANSSANGNGPRTAGFVRRIASTSSEPLTDLEQGLGRRRSASIGRNGTVNSASARRTSSPVDFGLENEDGQLHEDVVGLLDVIDPQVSTVNHLQNMTNSVIFPHFPQLWSRRPEVQLPETSSDESLLPLTGGEPSNGSVSARPRSATTGRSRGSSISRFLGMKSPSSTETRESSTAEPSASSWNGAHPLPIPEEAPPLQFAQTAPIALSVSRTESESHISSAPHLATVQELRQEELDDDVADIKADHELDSHVKNVLRQSKRAQAMKILKGVWTFVKTPMGAFTAIYGFLVAFWGAAIVLFLLGWIPTSSKYRQDVWVEISSQVENGLFTLTGVGLIPWRLVDTYRMSVIWTLRKKNERLRAKAGLPPIEDPNDLPDPRLIKDYVHVLSEKDQARLHYQQEKFAQSQTWYRPHATATHRAFPMSWALWNTILMDGNSFFQCLLCACMWSMSWHVRPPWTTGCLIPCSFLCGIGAAVLIWQGSARTKKNDTVSAKLREALGVPLAIAVPRTADTANSKTTAVTASDIPLTKTEKQRRTTVTFGDVEGKEKNRERGSTIAAPERRSEEHKELELKEVKTVV